jgi:exonuclease SbcC
MKPIELTFSGLQSYREEQTVHFNDMGTGGLFGIFGPTGAGKSTILDAMTLALYGEVERAKNKSQGIINTEEKGCAVSFTFAISGRKYLAERAFSRKKGDSFATEPKNVRLVDIDDGNVIADQTKVMNASVEKMLGMDFDRFCQTVILPQGKFDAFLKMEAAKRGEMLEDIFNLGEYGTQLHEKAKQLAADYDMQVKVSETQIKALGDYTPETIAETEKELAAANAKLTAAAKDKELLERHFQENQKLNEKLIEKEKLDKELVDLQAKKAEMAGVEAALKSSRKAEILRPEINQITTLYKESKRAEDELTHADQKWQTVKKAASAAEKDYEEKYIIYGDRINAINAELIRLTQAGDQEKNQQELAANLTLLKKDLADLNEEANTLQATAEKLGSQLMEAENALHTVDAAEKRAISEWKAADMELRRRQEADMAAVFAAGLKPGNPCPVCGSGEHPHKAESREEGIDWLAEMEAVKALEQAWEQCRTAVSEAKGLVDSVRQQIEEQNRILTAKQINQSQKQADYNEKAKQLQQIANAVAIITGGVSVAARKPELAKELAETQQKQKNLLAEHTGAASKLAAAGAEQQLCRQRKEEAAVKLENFKAELQIKIRNNGFTKVDDAKKALLEEEAITAKETELQKYHSDMYQKTTRQKLLRADIGDFNQAAMKQLAEDLKTISEHWQELIEMVAAEKNRLTQMKANAKLGAQYTKELEKLTKKQETASNLAKLLKGKAFVHFLARESLIELAADASRTLAQLSNQRYALEILDSERGNDFIMADNYNGGQRRPCSTLSGGEVFLVSISLALALSQKINMQGAPVEFFFLDEGFGSLDEEKLEIVMSVLSRLPADQRMVGVISHVQEMKDRLPRYIEVKPAVEGKGSEIKLVVN